MPWTALPPPLARAVTPLVTETGALLVTEAGSVLSVNLSTEGPWDGLGAPAAATWAVLVAAGPGYNLGYAEGY